MFNSRMNIDNLQGFPACRVTRLCNKDHVTTILRIHQINYPKLHKNVHNNTDQLIRGIVISVDCIRVIELSIKREVLLPAITQNVHGLHCHAIHTQ